MDPALIEFPSSLESERLTIRSPRPCDGEELHRAICETFDDLNVWLPWAKELPDEIKIKKFLQSKRVAFLGRQDLVFLLFLKGTETLVGSSGLHPKDWKIPKFEIGYWCRKKFQNQGYITESTVAISEFGFHRLNAERIEICCDSENVRSQKIPRKLGFCLEATLKNDIRSNSGELRDRLIFSKIRSS
ncbi:GNAT family N-acetyltransferase [Candidatus Poribacteria bacterium]|nr:GNAT family N-acetyltransferase [Candidatus Poribacteria bacterium]